MDLAGCRSIRVVRCTGGTIAERVSSHHISLPVVKPNMRHLHDSTLHFFIVWLLAPIFAIVGASLDQSACDLPTTQVS